MRIVKRSEAARAGLKRYYNGTPCRRGHDAERYTSNGMCCKCLQKPIGAMVRVSFEVHQEDRKEVEAFVAALAYQRGTVFQGQAEMSEDEKGYWQMIARHRKNGCPEPGLRKFRTYGAFTLPEGVDP